MKRSRFTETKTVSILKEGETGFVTYSKHYISLELRVKEKLLPFPNDSFFTLRVSLVHYGVLSTSLLSLV
jgi:hypothetical protein